MANTSRTANRAKGKNQRARKAKAKAAKPAKRSAMDDFFRQDPNDPRTYAGRKRERVRLGGLGDDGKLMTRPRMNAHRVLNIFFIWGLAAVAIGVAIAAASFFLGATIDAWTMKSSGGPMINGMEMSLAFRLEALYCIIVGTIMFGTSFLGFNWLYDGQPLSTSRKWCTVGIALSLGWLVFTITTFSIPDPVALVTGAIILAFIAFSNSVMKERAGQC